MTKRFRPLLAVASGLVTAAISHAVEPIQKTGIAAAAKPAGRSRDDAMREAEVLHTALHAALQVVHHHYYREDEGLPIPAATLKDVFAEMEEAHGIRLRWLAVEGQAMNTDHKARSVFETEAVDALKSGKRDFARIENGVLLRAGRIALGSHCLKCHVPDRKNTKERTAGLIIAIPLDR